MPTTALKNLIYRAALPVKAPGPGRRPAVYAEGRSLCTPEDYARLLRKHHVLNSAALLGNRKEKLLLTCSLPVSGHTVTGRSMFRVASITKMAAALAALSAAEEGKLIPDAPVNGIFASSAGIPAVPELEGVTLIHLLSHTSGLTDHAGLENDVNAGKPFPEVLRGRRNHMPGEAFQYSNLGFGLIGCLLEAVYGLPVSEILRVKVFEPLEMSATLEASSLDPASIVPIYRVLSFDGGMKTLLTPARGRIYDPCKALITTPLGRKPLREPDPLRHYGHTAGAMYTDVLSLEKMIRCLTADGRPLLGAELGKQMSAEHASYGTLSPTLRYGLGLLIIQDSSLSEGRILGHQGFAYGCADGAFWEENSGRVVLFLNGGASEARDGRLGLCNRDILRWALKKEMPKWIA